MANLSRVWDASYMPDKIETTLQRFVRLALEQAPRARDYYDKVIQAASGTTGKPLYDLQRGRGLNPRTPMLRHMAEALGQPLPLIRRAADGEEVNPIPVGAEDTSDVEPDAPTISPSIEHLAAELDLALVEEIDLAFGMGATFIDHAPQAVGVVPFRMNWVREMFRGPMDALKVVRGSGDSMEPTIRSGDFVLVDTSRRRLDDQDAIWAIAYGELGMIRRLRQMPGGGVLMMPDNSVVRPIEAHDGEMHIVGKVIWIGRRM